MGHFLFGPFKRVKVGCKSKCGVQSSNSISLLANFRSSLSLQNGSTKPETSRNPPSYRHRLTRVHSSDSVSIPNLPCRTRRRVETRPDSAKVVSHRIRTSNRVPTRWWLGSFPSRPSFHSSLFDMGVSPRNAGFSRYLEARIQIQARFSVFVIHVLFSGMQSWFW